MQPQDNLHPPILDQLEAYEAVREGMERDYFSRWVVFYHGAFQGGYDSFDTAEEARRTKGIKTHESLVRQVGKDHAIILAASDPAARPWKYPTTPSPTGNWNN